MKEMLINLEIILKDPGLYITGHYFFMVCIILFSLIF